MASIYDKASLVLIPSGTKTSKVYSQKPTNGDGDFTFSRSTAATRVNASGNIEKETQNLLLQSVNMTSGSWTQQSQGTRVLATDPLGGNTAVTLNDTDPVGYYRIESSQYGVSGVITASVYVKKTTGALLNYAGFDIAAINNYVIFDTTNGTYNLTGPSSDYIDVNVVSYDANWWRVSMTGVVSSSNVFRMWPAISFDGGGIGASAQGANTFWAPQVEQGLVARDYIETTTTAIYGGITDNVPRLDYQGSCPALLLEPQRTNSITQSEYFGSDWVIQDVSLTANSVTSPEGVQNATTLTEDVTNQRHRIYYYINTTSGTSYTLSVFVKKNSSGRFLLLNANSAFNARAVVNLDTLEITNINGTDAKIEDYGNGWYKFSISGQATISSSQPIFVQIQNAASDVSYLGDGSSLYLYGAQLEVGSYATSYIPTYGSAVTRNGDSCSKTGVSSLIGQTEGTMYVDVNLSARDSYTYFALAPNLGSTTAYIGMGITSTAFLFEVVNSGVQVVYNYPNSSTGNFKMAFAYKANDFVAYVNGTQVMTDTSGSVPSCSQIGLNVFDKDQPLLYKQALLFPTRLSNDELATLTTI